MKNNPVAKALTVMAFAATMFTSCSKKGNDTPEPNKPPVTDGYKLEYATKFRFGNLSASNNNNPTEVQVHNGTERLGIFNSNASGTYRAEFHGLSGRKMLNGDPSNASTMTNLAVWPMQAGDTLKVFKDGVLYRDYVTKIDANTNNNYEYSVLSGQTVTQVRDAGNSYTDLNNSSSSSLKNQQLKPLQ